MAKEKKQITIKQQKNKARAIQYLTFGGEFLSILTPFIALGIVNKDEWFLQNPNNWKIGLGGALAIVLMGIAVMLVSKNKEKGNEINGYVALVVGWFAAAFIFMLLADIMTQIANIMWFGGIGLLGAFGLDVVSVQYKNKANDLKEAIKEANKEINKEQAKQEIIKEKNKVVF